MINSIPFSLNYLHVYIEITFILQISSHVNGYIAYPVSVAIDPCFSTSSNVSVNILVQYKDQDFRVQLRLVTH